MSATATIPGAGWALADGWTIARRDLQHWRRQPGQVLTVWFFPVLMVVMFGGLFGGAMEVPGGGSYYDLLMPGMFGLTMLFGLEGTMTAVAVDAQKGVTDRFRSLPIASTAVVLGRCIADLLSSIAGLLVLIATGLLLGWRWEDGFAPALAAVGLLLLLRFAALWIGIFAGLAIGSPEGVAAVQTLIWPVGLVSSVLVDTTTMPSWLGVIAQWNPLSSTVNAARDLFGNPGATGDSWIVQNSLLMAIVWPVLLVAIFLPLSARRFRRLGG
ncbi:ABC transporter permease [Kribbella deserti]|uniref:Transport permease protein n=1 Tax=Kribbella deserti TaxID=1926257 RepID=A0ABV6QWH2_9ACTN